MKILLQLQQLLAETLKRDIQFGELSEHQVTLPVNEPRAKGQSCFVKCPEREGINRAVSWRAGDSQSLQQLLLPCEDLQHH